MTFGRIINWNNTQSDTLNSIPSDERKAGLIVSFKDPSKGWTVLQYIADTVYNNTMWGIASNWKDITSDSVKEDLSAIKESVLELDDSKLDKELDKNLADPSEFQLYGYTETGYILQNGNFSRTGLIHAKDNLIMNCPHSSSIYSAVYDEDKKFVRAFQSNQYTKQEGERYVSFVFANSYKDTLQVEEGTESTDFVEFTKTKSIDEKIKNVDNKVQDTYSYTDNLSLSLHKRLSIFEEKYVEIGNAVDGLSAEAKWYDHITQSWKTGGNMFSVRYEANMAYFKTSQTGNPNGYFIVYLDKDDKFLGGFINGLENEKPEIRKTYFLLAPLGTKYIVYQAQGGSNNIFSAAVIVGLDELYNKISSYDILFQRKAVAQTVNFGTPPKGKEKLSILFIGNSFCGQMYQYLEELTAASGHAQVIYNSVARGGKTYKYWLDDLQYEDSYPEGYLDQDNPTDDGQYDTTFDRTDTLYKRLTNPPKDNYGYGDNYLYDRKWDIICVCGLPCQNIFDFSQDNPYTIQMVEKIRRVVQDRNIPIYLYVPPVPPSPNSDLGEEQVWGNIYSTSDEALGVANQILIDKMSNMGIPVNRLIFASVGIQNLRKRVKVYQTKGNIKYNSELTIDRLHPFYGLPYLVTSAICYQTILEEVFDNINAIEDMKDIRAKLSGSENLSIGDDNIKYAIDAVKGALLDSWNLNSYLDETDILTIENLAEYNESLT